MSLASQVAILSLGSLFIAVSGGISYAVYKLQQQVSRTRKKQSERQSTKICLHELQSFNNITKPDKIHKETDNDTSKAVQSFNESDYKPIQPPSPESVTSYRSSTIDSDTSYDYHEELRKENSIVKIVEMLHQNRIWHQSETIIRIYLLLNHYPYKIVFEVLQLKQIMKTLPSNSRNNHNWLQLAQMNLY